MDHIRLNALLLLPPNRIKPGPRSRYFSVHPHERTLLRRYTVIPGVTHILIKLCPELLVRAGDFVVILCQWRFETFVDLEYELVGEFKVARVARVRKGEREAGAGGVIGRVSVVRRGSVGNGEGDGAEYFVGVAAGIDWNAGLGEGVWVDGEVGNDGDDGDGEVGEDGGGEVGEDGGGGIVVTAAAAAPRSGFFGGLFRLGFFGGFFRLGFFGGLFFWV